MSVCADDDRVKLKWHIYVNSPIFKNPFYKGFSPPAIVIGILSFHSQGQKSLALGTLEVMVPKGEVSR